MADNKIPVGGRLHSVATGNVLAGADEILDESKNKKQSDINTETYSLVNDINERLSGLSPDQQSALSVATKATNNETKLGYYVCDTLAATAAKVISATGYVLSLGGSIKVKMTNANTAANATLNINSTGAKALYYAGERVSANNSWEAGETVEVYYDGTNFYANNVAGSGSGDGVFDVSAKTGDTYETLSAALSAANSILSANRKKGGMSIKYQQLTPATYSVVKTEGVETLPTGTEVESALSITDGEYTAAQLSEVATLPSAVGSSITYFLAVEETVESETVTTYTTWKITMESSDGVKYVQYRLTATSWSSNEKDWENLETSDIRKKIFLKDLLTYTRNTSHKKAANASDGSFVNNAGGSSATYYMSDLIDVRNINQLRCMGYASSNNGTALLVRAQDISGNYIKENSIASEQDLRSKEFLWKKQEGTTHVRVFFNTAKPFYAYAYPVVEDLENIESRVSENENDIAGTQTDVKVIVDSFTSSTDKIELFESERFEAYSKTERHVLNGDDGSIYSNIFGNPGTYYVVSWMDVLCIKGIEYVFPFPNKITTNVALIAAYDADKNYIPENSVVITNGVKTYKGVWIKSENTRYVRFTVYYNNGNSGCSGVILNAGKELTSIKENLNILNTITNEIDINNLNKDRDTSVANLLYYNTTLKLLHFSDLHWHPDNAKRILEWYNKHSKYVDGIINTGDTVYVSHTNEIGYGDTEGVEIIMNVIGNHDLISSSSGGDYTTYNGVPLYNKFIKPYIKTTTEEGTTVDNWGVVQPEGAEENGYCYYYKDYQTQGIRLIVLDTIVNFKVESTQRTWFQTVLANAREQGLGVVVACHWLSGEKTAIKNHFAIWTDRNQSGGSANNTNAMLSDVQSFIDDGGEFCCYLVGHNHSDYISKITAYPQQLCINVGAACGLQRGYESKGQDIYGSIRELGKRSQDCFNVVGINKANKTITIIKIGVDINIYGQKMDSVVIDYETKKEVFSNYSEG